MKYIARELLNGTNDLDNFRELELRECENSKEATQFVEDMMKNNLELRLKRQKKDYDKVLHVELYFERKHE